MDVLRIGSLEQKVYNLEISNLGLHQKVYALEGEVGSVKSELSEVRKTQDVMIKMLGDINQSIKNTHSEIAGEILAKIDTKIKGLESFIHESNQSNQVYFSKRIETLENLMKR